MHGRVRKPTTNPIILFRRICRKYGLVAKHLDGNRFKLYDVEVKVVGMSHVFKVRDGVVFIITANTNRTTVAYNTEVLMVFDNGSLDIRSSYIDTIASLASVALKDVIA